MKSLLMKTKKTSACLIANLGMNKTIRRWIIIAIAAITIGAFKQTSAKVPDSILEEQTFAVLRFDPLDFEPTAISKWLNDSAGLSNSQDTTDPHFAGLLNQFTIMKKKWKLTNAGPIFWITGLTQLTSSHGPFLSAVPLTPETNRKALSDLMIDSGFGSETRIMENTMICSSVEVLDRVSQSGGLAGDEFHRILETMPRATLNGAIVLSEEMKKVIEQLMPELPASAGGIQTDLLTRGLEWIGLSVSSPPDFKLELRAKTSGEKPAAELNRWIRSMLNQAAHQLDQADPTQQSLKKLVSSLKTEIKGNTLTLLADKEKGGKALAARSFQMVTKARSKAKSVQCINNMKQIGMAGRIYAADHADRYPEDWKSLKEHVWSPVVFVCPSDRSAAKTNNDWKQFDFKNTTYDFISPGATVTIPNTVVFHCPIHGNVSLADGSVQTGSVTERLLKNTLERQAKN